MIPTAGSRDGQTNNNSNERSTKDFGLAALGIALSIIGGCAYAWKMAQIPFDLIFALAGALSGRIRPMYGRSLDITVIGWKAELYGVLMILSGMAIGIEPFRKYFARSWKIETFSPRKKALAYSSIAGFFALCAYSPVVMTKIAPDISGGRVDASAFHPIVNDDKRQLSLAKDLANELEYLPHDQMIKRIRSITDWDFLPALEGQVDVLQNKGRANLSREEAELYDAMERQIEIIRATRRETRNAARIR